MSDRLEIRVAVFVVLEKDNQIFLLRRANTGWADGMLTLPSGHIDKGETAVEAAIKETREEAGVEVQAEDLEFLHVHYVHDAYVNFYFKATTWEGEAVLNEPHLCSEVMWVNKNEIPEDAIYHVKNLFEQMKTDSKFSDIENDPNPDVLPIS